MIKDDPRLILNLNIKDEELEKKIELSINDYIDKNIDKLIADKVEAAVMNSVEKYFKDTSRVSSYEKRKFFWELDNKIDQLIDKSIDERIYLKIIDKASKLLGNSIKEVYEEK